MDKINKLLFLALAFLTSVSLTAQDNVSTSAKIDSIYTLQKKVYAEVKNEPLYNKKYGVELNLFRLMYLDKQFTLSGGFSFFNVDRDAEISIPFYFQKPKDAEDLTEFTLDGHYRYFLGKYQKGFYLSVFVRYAYLHGTLGDNDLFVDNTTSSILRKGSQSKLGFGFGIGYRIFSRKGFYWGTSFSFGRYVLGNNNKFKGDFLSYDDDNEYILDVELLKFGWSF